MRHLTETDYAVSSWSGGKTVQIAIGPPEATYARRDFSWRLSSATVELDESDFTPLPDYRRLIAPLRGTLRLTHNGGPALELVPCQVHAFDGSDDTHSRGRCTDFNLMLRKGICDGEIGALERGAGAHALFRPKRAADAVILYCAWGRAAITLPDRRAVLAAGEALYLSGPCVPTAALRFEEAGCVMTAQVWPL